MRESVTVVTLIAVALWAAFFVLAAMQSEQATVEARPVGPLCPMEECWSCPPGWHRYCYPDQDGRRRCICYR